MAKKKKLKPNDPDFFSESTARLSDDQIDELFVHMIRRPNVFEEATSRLPTTLLKEAGDRHRVLMKACQNLAKSECRRPGTKKFMRQLLDEVRRIGTLQEHDDLLVEAVEELASEDGFIQDAFAIDKAGLSDELGLKLLKQYLSELQVLDPLDRFLAEYRNSSQMPSNLPTVLEQLLERSLRLDGIGAKGVRTIEEEWGEHNTRLEKFRGRTMIGLKTGLKELDRRTLGLRGLFIFGAKPGAGKTTYAGVEVALGVCRHHQDNAALSSCSASTWTGSNSTAASIQIWVTSSGCL